MHYVRVRAPRTFATQVLARAIFAATRYDSGIATTKPARAARGIAFIGSLAIPDANTAVTAVPATAVPSITQRMTAILSMGLSDMLHRPSASDMLSLLLPSHRALI